jgi:uncharacterized protein
MRRLDLRSLRFDESGETWRRLPVEVASFMFGGLEYELVGDAVDVLLTAGRVGGNVTLVAEFEADLVGPCQRCLAEAVIPVRVRAVEYAQHGESEVDDEDTVGYVSANVLDLERWARDLLAEALPDKLLCAGACRGLCQVCGVDLNADPEHRHGAP